MIPYVEYFHFSTNIVEQNFYSPQLKCDCWCLVYYYRFMSVFIFQISSNLQNCRLQCKFLVFGKNTFRNCTIETFNPEKRYKIFWTEVDGKQVQATEKFKQQWINKSYGIPERNILIPVMAKYLLVEIIFALQKNPNLNKCAKYAFKKKKILVVKMINKKKHQNWPQRIAKKFEILCWRRSRRQYRINRILW